MKKLKSLVGACCLALSLSGVALADGGITHGPGFSSPPPPPTGEAASFAQDAEVQDSASVELTMLIVWLELSIL